MHAILRITVSLLFISIIACAPKDAPTSRAEQVQLLKFDHQKMSFTYPRGGIVFTLHLGDHLKRDTGGIAAVPKDIQGDRYPTSSYWEPTDSHASYFPAESQYTKHTGPWLEFLQIQYDPVTGIVLITEDVSDSLQCIRHILYTPGEHGGFTVTYLQPPYAPAHEGSAVVPLADITLLPGGKAKILTKVRKVEQIRQSTVPFSVGG